MLYDVTPVLLSLILVCSLGSPFDVVLLEFNVCCEFLLYGDDPKQGSKYVTEIKQNHILIK
jgi:hypothetical protein